MTDNLISQPATSIVTSKPSLKNLWPHIVLASIIFALFIVIGLRASPELAGTTLEELKQTLMPIMETMGAFGPFALLFIIFLNNAIKSLGAIVLGILLGIPPITFIAANGFMIGVAALALQSSIGYGVIVASLVPHGIIEIPLLLLSSALGLSIGKESVKYLLRQKSSVRGQLRNGIRIYLKWILVGLFIAAIIEVFITPLFMLLIGGKELFIK